MASRNGWPSLTIRMAKCSPSWRRSRRASPARPPLLHHGARSRLAGNRPGTTRKHANSAVRCQGNAVHGRRPTGAGRLRIACLEPESGAILVKDKEGSVSRHGCPPVAGGVKQREIAIAGTPRAEPGKHRVARSDKLKRRGANNLRLAALRRDRSGVGQTLHKQTG